MSTLTLPRGKEVARLRQLPLVQKVMRLLADLGLNGEALIERHYGEAPFHGRHHPYLVILCLHWLSRSGTIYVPPIGLALGLLHDAGHDGRISRSPEAMSAAIAAVEFQRLLVALSPPEAGTKNGLREALRVLGMALEDTRFPYLEPARSEEYGAKLRTADVLAPFILSADALGVDAERWTPFRVWFYYNAPLYWERQADGCTLSFIDWCQQENVRFLDRLLEYLYLQYFVCDTTYTRWALMKCRNRMAYPLDSDHGRNVWGTLERAFDFLRKDITLPEFLQYCAEHDL